MVGTGGITQALGSWLAVVVALGVGPIPSRAADPAPPAGTSRALIIAGLPGDAEHETLFAETARQWRTWLTGPLGFDARHVQVLFGKTPPEGCDGAATGPAVQRAATALRQALRPEDRLWVFFLGHGNYDGEHAYFHLAGRDLSEDQLGRLFRGLRCREQVFWMTTSASGWFLRSLSAPGRIVITATAADEEYNETEFPQALVTAAQLSIEQLDKDKDGKVSVLELYLRTVAEVEARFAADKRLPTEHAQLDDNGDGRGTELTPDKEPKKPADDGWRAAHTFLPLRPARPTK